MNERQEKTSDILGKLTVLGTIVLPMNVVTGIWGMNCKFLTRLVAFSGNYDTNIAPRSRSWTRHRESDLVLVHHWRPRRLRSPMFPYREESVWYSVIIGKLWVEVSFVYKALQALKEIISLCDSLVILNWAWSWTLGMYSVHRGSCCFRHCQYGKSKYIFLPHLIYKIDVSFN
jgi:hypothetical protein